MKVLFFGDGRWACLSLQAILKTNEFDVVGVVLRNKTPDLALKLISEKNEIPVYIPEKVNSTSVIEDFKALNPDLCVSMSYDQIIKANLRQIPKDGFINCHAGKLPNYRGRNVINWALINDEKEIGITVHFIDDGIDTGDIISQIVIPITEKDHYGTLLEKVTKKCPEVLLDAMLKIKKGTVQPIKQNHINGSYYSYRREGDELIDWSWGSRRIHNFIRALYHPAPGAQSYYRGKKVHIWESCETDYPNYISACGEIIKREEDGVIVKTGDNAIKILKVSDSIDGPKYVPRFVVGERLGINFHKKICELEQEIKKLKEALKDF